VGGEAGESLVKSGGPRDSKADPGDIHWVRNNRHTIEEGGKNEPKSLDGKPAIGEKKLAFSDTMSGKSPEKGALPETGLA